jgi:uncharacterized protein
VALIIFSRSPACIGLLVIVGCGLFHPARAQRLQTEYRVLAMYSDKVEHDHVDFAQQAIRFFSTAARKDHFSFTATTNWNDLNTANLTKYDLILWLNDSPHTGPQRKAFEEYMKHGGGWLGLHVAAYTDGETDWPWFTSFLGSAVFSNNSWPPLPAILNVDDPSHPIARGIPQTFLSPSNEWYVWTPSPRLHAGVRVLLTLSPSNYPLGLKDTIVSGDVPVVWTNTAYRMLYLNMGHGDRIFSSDMQNQLFENAVLWLAPASFKPLR